MVRFYVYSKQLVIGLRCEIVSKLAGSIQTSSSSVLSLLLKLLLPRSTCLYNSRHIDFYVK